MNQPLYIVDKVQVIAKKDHKNVVILNNVSFDIKKEEILGLIGKTGSGKTMIAKFLIDLLPDGVNLKHGDLFFESKTVLKTRASMRGIIISMIFQDPLKAHGPQAIDVISELPPHFNSSFAAGYLLHSTAKLCAGKAIK